MRKKKYYLFISIVVFYLSFCPFLWVNAKSSEQQPEVCAWPSKMMALYFQFQNDMMSAMLWSEINEKRFATTKTDGGLFTEKYLTLGTGSINALDMLATSIRWNMKAAWSSITTLSVLLGLAAISVWQSNTEGLRILTKDRVIVREYKHLLDIETSLMELAYYLSQHVSLVNKIDWNLMENIKSVIKKYQNLWLLEEKDSSVGEVTIADIMSEMFTMNMYMKHFILFNGWLGGFESTILPKFSEEAINQLEEAYRWQWVFWACNQYASNIKNTRDKWVKNSKESLATSRDDVKSATERLGSVFGLWNWKNKSQDSNRCDMSEYEMAQLKAYRWWNWTCKTWLVNGNVGSAIQDFIKEKKARQVQKEKTTTLSKEEKKAAKEEKKANKKATKEEKKATKKYLESLLEDINKAGDIAKKKNAWRDTFWTGVMFNVEYSGWFNIDLVEMYSDLMNNYRQSQENAVSSDLSYELVNIKALLDQVDIASNRMDELKDKLREIAKYQCRNWSTFY